jgi:hypothetical protein
MVYCHTCYCMAYSILHRLLKIYTWLLTDSTTDTRTIHMLYATAYIYIYSHTIHIYTCCHIPYTSIYKSSRAAEAYIYIYIIYIQHIYSAHTSTSSIYMSLHIYFSPMYTGRRSIYTCYMAQKLHMLLAHYLLHTSIHIPGTYTC